MRNHKNLFLSACIVLACAQFSACDNTDDSRPTPVPEPSIGNLMDVKDVTLNSLVIDDIQERFLTTKVYENSYQAQEKDNAEHAPLDYANMRLYIYKVRDGIARPKMTAEQNAEFYRFGKKVIEGLYAASEDSELKKKDVAMNFMLAQLNGQVRITADVTLFGQEAGTDLSSHFCAKGPNTLLPQGKVESPSILYDCNTEHPTAVGDFFAQGSWLQERYIFWLADVPEEKYEEVRFKINIPVRCEYWEDYYAQVSKDVKTEERVLSTEVTLKRGSKVSLNDMLQETTQCWE